MKNTIYKENPHGRYALYKSSSKSNLWKESASVTNEQLQGDTYEHSNTENFIQTNTSSTDSRGSSS